MNKESNICKNIISVLLTLLILGVAAGTASAAQAPVDLGTAHNFVILTKTGISTTGTTSIVGDIGVSPAAATYITGFDLIMDASNQFSTSSLVTGKVYASDYTSPTPAYMTTAISDMEAAYTDAAGRTIPDATELGAGDISGMTLAPGLYKWSSGVLINSHGVTLDCQGNTNAVFIFQIAQKLTVGSGAIVTLSGGCQANNIFWQVAEKTTLEADSVINGNILDATLIEMKDRATLNGRALAQTAVTLIANNVTAPSSSVNLTIASYAPTSPVSDTVGATRAFNITANQIVNVTWYINGTSVQDNVSVPVDTQVNYTNTSAVEGVWNVTAIALNTTTGLSASQEWLWKVRVASITGFTLDTNGIRGKWINASVNITNNGSTSQWFVIDVSGVNVADGYPLVATATVRLNASETLPDIPVLITVPPSASTGTYNLFAGIWKHEDFAIPDKLITIQGPQTVTIS